MKYVQILIFIGFYTAASIGSEAASCEKGFNIIRLQLTKDNFPPEPEIQGNYMLIKLANSIGENRGIRLLSKQLDSPQPPEKLIAIAEAVSQRTTEHRIQVLEKISQIPNLPTEVQQAIIHYAFFRIRRSLGFSIIRTMIKANPPSTEIKALIINSANWAFVPDS